MLQYCIKQILTHINKHILHVLLIKLRDKLYFSFSIPTPGFPHFYYVLDANLGLLLYGEVSVMKKHDNETWIQKPSFLPPGYECPLLDMSVQNLCFDRSFNKKNDMKYNNI